MMDRTPQPLVSRDTDALSPAGPGASATRSIRHASMTAGVGLLLMSALAVFGNFVVLEGLVTPGDAARTAQDIMASERLFRFGVVSLYSVIVLDVVVAWALYWVFSPAGRNLSLLAAWLRIVYAGVFLVAVGELLAVLRLLGDDDHLSAFRADQLHAQALSRIDAFSDIWGAGLVLFGVHLLVVGYLAYRSGYVPRFLGVLVALAGFGYVFDSVGAVLSGRSAPEIGAFTFVGEFLLAVWLVIWGRRLTMRRRTG